MRRGRSGAEDGIVDTCSELYVFVSLVFRSGAKFSEDARLAEADANALSRLRSDIMAWLSFFRAWISASDRYSTNGGCRAGQTNLVVMRSRIHRSYQI